MAKAKKIPPEKDVKSGNNIPKLPKKKSKYDITVKAPEGMTFEDMVKMAVNTPLPKKNKK